MRDGLGRQHGTGMPANQRAGKHASVLPVGNRRTPLQGTHLQSFQSPGKTRERRPGRRVGWEWEGAGGVFCTENFTSDSLHHPSTLMSVAFPGSLRLRWPGPRVGLGCSLQPGPWCQMCPSPLQAVPFHGSPSFFYFFSAPFSSCSRRLADTFGFSFLPTRVHTPGLAPGLPRVSVR